MPIISAFVAGSVLYAGAKTYFKHRHRKRFVWLLDDTGKRSPHETIIIDNPDPIQLAQTNDVEFSVSTVSLGVTLISTLAYSPLSLISLPLSVYNSIPIFEEAFEVVFLKRSFRFVLVSSSIIVTGLLTDLQSLASLVQWLHFLNRKLLLNMLAAKTTPVPVESVATATS
jgi:hypothetical protein